MPYSGILNGFGNRNNPLGLTPVNPMDYYRAPEMAPSNQALIDGMGGIPEFTLDSSTLNGGGAGGNAWDGFKSWAGDANNLNAAFQGVSALTGAYLGFQQMKHAKDQLRFQKEAYNTNMNNSIQSYNTSLEDRIRGRTSAYEGKENDVQSYLDKNRLSRSGG